MSSPVRLSGKASLETKPAGNWPWWRLFRIGVHLDLGLMYRSPTLPVTFGLEVAFWRWIGAADATLTFFTPFALRHENDPDAYYRPKLAEWLWWRKGDKGFPAAWSVFGWSLVDHYWDLSRLKYRVVLRRGTRARPRWKLQIRFHLLSWTFGGFWGSTSDFLRTIDRQSVCWLEYAGAIHFGPLTLALARCYDHQAFELPVVVLEEGE